MLSGRRTFILSFVLALTLLIAFTSQVDARPSPAAVAPAHRRQANRMIKKRQGLDLGIIGVGEDPADPSGSTTTTATETTATDTETTSESTSAGTGTTTETTPASSSTPITSSETETETETTPSETSTSSTEETTSESSTTEESSSIPSSEPQPLTDPATSESPTVTPAPDVAALTTSDPITSTVTNTHSAEQESTSETAAPTGSTSISKTAITIIAVVGGSIVAIVILWTIIRKWKLSPSDKFDDRLQPIDWSPDATQGPAAAGLNRSASGASHGSFHSAGSDHDSLSGPRRYNTNGSGGLVADLPTHDFTAGPAHLGGGYADLHRGPSPGPQMSSVARGPSFNRGYGY